MFSEEERREYRERLERSLREDLEALAVARARLDGSPEPEVEMSGGARIYFEARVARCMLWLDELEWGRRN